MPKDLLHGIPVFALAIVFLIVLVLQFAYARVSPKSDADATAEKFIMRTPLRYAVLYGVLTLLCAAILVVFAVLKLDSILFYVLGGVMLVFSAGELYGALRRRIIFEEGVFTVRSEFGGEEKVRLDAILEANYKKSFSGESVKAFGAEGKLFEADLVYRNFEYLKAALEQAGLIQTHKTEAPTETQDEFTEDIAETADDGADETRIEESK